jgi:hypothetical protein
MDFIFLSLTLDKGHSQLYIVMGWYPLFNSSRVTLHFTTTSVVGHDTIEFVTIPLQA